MARKKLDLSKLQTDTPNHKVEPPKPDFINGYTPMPREQLAYNSIFRLCTDKTGVLSSVEDCQRIITALEHLASIVVPDELEEKKELITICEDKIKVFEDKVTIETYTNYIKVFTLDLVFKVNQVCLIVLEKSQTKPIKYSELKELVKTNNIDLKIDLSKATNFETIKADISDILENLNRVFPEFKIPKRKRVKASNKAYKLNNNEWSPNSPQSNDILSNIIKPYLWTSESDRLQCLTKYKKKSKDIGYSQLSLFRTDSTGDLVPSEDYSAETILEGFDLRDRKILRLLMIEAVHHKGESFPISGKWLLKLIGDDRSSVMVNGNRLNSLEKLEDLERRLWRYELIRFQWSYTVGKQEFNNLPDGFPVKGTFKIFGLNDVAIFKQGRGYELSAVITPSSWFDFNQKKLQQFTKIPKQLLAIDIYKYPRAYLIGERICELFRINKEKINKSGSNYQSPLTITIKNLLDEIISPIDLEKALTDSRKGYRLKERIKEDTKYLSELLNWRFNWRGDKEGDNFNSFYNSASFTVILDCELEAEILGEKVIERKRVKAPLYLDGEQLLALRKKLKLTQDTFGKALGYTKSYISKIERGHDPSQEFIKVLYQHYGSLINEILS